MAIKVRNNTNWLEGKTQNGMHLFLLSLRKKGKQIRVFFKLGNAT